MTAAVGAADGQRAVRPRPELLGRLARTAFNALPLLLLAGIWQAVSQSGLISPRLLPPFSAVAGEAWAMLRDGAIYRHLWTSLYRAIAGLALGASVGIVLGVLMAMVPVARRALYPLLTLSYTLPKSALIPIAFLWLGVGDASVILVVTLATLVPLVLYAFHGAEAVPEPYLWSARSMGTPRARMTASIVLPAAMPHIASGLRIALALSIVVTISAEMVASFVGIGRFIFIFGESGSYTHMFAAILIAVFAVFLIDRLFAHLARHLLRWTEGERSGV